jgi:cyclopropane fatty-acyl-phospholipid synthase-like methyltransferase
MTPAPEWFREWFDSIYYHKLYFERNEQEAAAFIGRLLAVLKPPPGAKMLDVACGRGRHSRILADQGFEVTGIDLAPSSIAYARQFRNDHLDFYVHDMRQLLCTSCFEYVFNFFTSFGYFRTRRENENSIRTISLAMKKEGVFVLDYLNSRYTKDHLVPHSEILIDGVKYDLTRWFDEKHFYKKIKIQDPQQPAPLTFTERIARFSPDDFAAMLTRGGLAIRQLYGSYALDPFDIIRSPRLIIIAAKAP